jgi:hypothetical protein
MLTEIAASISANGFGVEIKDNTLFIHKIGLESVAETGKDSRVMPMREKSDTMQRTAQLQAARARIVSIPEKTFRKHAWVLCLEWEQNPEWTEDEYLWTPQDVKDSLEIKEDERDLGIIKKTIYRDGEIWHSVEAEVSLSDKEPQKETPMRPTFRLWDNQLRCFVDDPGFCIGLDGSIRYGIENCDPDRYIIEQCLAIDKHGMPTYIGDIITCEFSWYGREMQERHLVKFNAHWYASPFHHWFFAGERKLWIEVLLKKFEVIGNIHEHPDLIDKPIR